MLNIILTVLLVDVMVEIFLLVEIRRERKDKEKERADLSELVILGKMYAGIGGDRRDETKATLNHLSQKIDTAAVVAKEAAKAAKEEAVASTEKVVAEAAAPIQKAVDSIPDQVAKLVAEQIASGTTGSKHD